jgi:hypothetical protein
MAKKARYKVLKASLEKGTSSMEDIFEVVRPTPIRKDLRISWEAISNKQKNPGRFRIDELVKLADLIDCDPMLLLKTAYEEYRKKHPRVTE